MGWTTAWIVGAVVITALAWLLRAPWMRTGAPPVYARQGRECIGYILGIVGLCYAAYLAASLATGRGPTLNLHLHLAMWTLGPPIWFFVEWFLWFDNHHDDRAVARLRQEQEMASKVWAAGLALLISYGLQEAVKQHGKPGARTVQEVQALGPLPISGSAGHSVRANCP